MATRTSASPLTSSVVAIKRKPNAERICEVIQEELSAFRYRAKAGGGSCFGRGASTVDPRSYVLGVSQQGFFSILPLALHLYVPFFCFTHIVSFGSTAMAVVATASEITIGSNFIGNLNIDEILILSTSTDGADCAIKSLMTAKMAIGVFVALALLVAPVRLQANTCIVVNGVSEKACQPGCCANKTCCATSAKRTGPSAQPLAKAASTDVLTLVAPAVVAISITHPTVTRSIARADVISRAHSPPRAALLCTFLI